jgi:hypothetical protein
LHPEVIAAKFLDDTEPADAVELFFSGLISSLLNFPHTTWRLLHGRGPSAHYIPNFAELDQYMFDLLLIRE